METPEVKSLYWIDDLTEFVREDDGERIGFLKPDGSLWQPLNLLGVPLGDSMDMGAAENTLLENAMPSIIEPYWCRLPHPLQGRLTDARAVDASEGFRQVNVVEVNLNTATLKLKSPFEDEQVALIILSLPAHDMLFREQPNI